MTNPPLTIHIMTATMAPGDAIGNYILTSARIWRQWGARVEIYADHVAPVYGGLVKPSVLYRDSGAAILWYHYSIYADNLEIAAQSRDFKVMDYHGVTPPHLFAGQNRRLQRLCQMGLDRLPDLRHTFDLYVVHSEYTRQALRENGYDEAIIHKLPLVVDTSRFDGATDADLGALLQQLDYLLFVGRVVPQKDILALLDIFAAVWRQRPSTGLILVGSRDQAPAYQRQIDRAIKKKGLAGRVLLTGQVNDTAVLAALLQHAAFLLVTSEWETFCVPVVEAMYFGAPPLVHAVPPLPEVAGTGGVVIDKHDVAETAVTILNLFADKARREQLSQAARARSALFTQDALAQALLNLLRQQLGQTL